MMTMFIRGKLIGKKPRFYLVENHREGEKVQLRSSGEGWPVRQGRKPQGAWKPGSRSSKVL